MIIALTGAGISQQSGIPTFEDLPDLRCKLNRVFANNNPDEYCEIIKLLRNYSVNAKPNDAHLALAEYKIPVITMNIDGLHKIAGSEVLELHGSLPEESEIEYASLLVGKPILYGDIAPYYQKAINIISQLGKGDIFLIIGAYSYTEISQSLKKLAYINNVEIVEILEDAKKNVRIFLENKI